MQSRNLLLCVVVPAAVLAHGTAIAQVSPPAPADARAAQGDPAAQSSGSQLEEIIVTAQRREQRLQDVPIAVSAVSGEALTSRGVTNLLGLTPSVPGLQVAVTGAATSIYLRGIGENGGAPENEASVATYIDGVYIASNSATFNALNNIQRIEVLKGPQGTLFGRNATGGVIQIVTKDPSQTPSAMLTAGYGNYDTVSSTFYGTTPLTSNLAIDLAASYRNQMDGFGRNVTRNTETNKSRDFVIRSKILWTPGDRTEVRLAGDYADGFSSRGDYVFTPGNSGFDGVPSAGGFDTRGSFPAFTTRQGGGGSVRIDHDLDAVKFTSISAYRVLNSKYQADYDATPLDIVFGYFPARQHNFSQEFQISSSSGSAIEWLVGAFYFNNSVRRGSEAGGLAYFPLTIVSSNTRQRTESLAGYAQATATLIDKLKLTGGFRFTSERQKFDGTTQIDNGPVITLAPAKQGYDKPTWRLALDYAFADAIHGYVSYNRGVKSGGFNLSTFSTYNPETLDAYEVGLKSELLDRRLRLNIAAFQYDYRDIQLTVINATNGLAEFTNAAKARIRGVEADLQAMPVENLTISAAASYLHGKYLSFPNAPNYSGNGPSTAPPVIDASGRSTIYTPKFTGNVGFNYVIPSDSGEFTLTSNLYYNDGFWFGADQHFRQPSHFLLTASVGWTSPNERLGLRVWGANLANEKYYASGSPSFLGNLANRADPRTYGVTGTLKF